MNSKEIADAIKHHMKHTGYIATDAKLNNVAMDFKWNVGVFEKPDEVRELVAMRDSLKTWQVSSAEIAKCALEQLPTLDHSEIDFDNMFTGFHVMFICLWAEEVAMHTN